MQDAVVITALDGDDNLAWGVARVIDALPRDLWESMLRLDDVC